jgi:hypothetical protein
MKCYYQKDISGQIKEDKNSYPAEQKVTINKKKKIIK